MKTVLSVDVAKNKSMIMLMNSDGEIFIDTKEINHNLEDFEKVKFYPGFPDGYYLDIYDLQNECHHEFEDKHEKSEIYDYFKNIKADTPKHLKYLIIEIMIELSIIGILEKIKKR